MPDPVCHAVFKTVMLQRNNLSSLALRRHAALLISVMWLTGCTVLGPNCARPEVVLPADWDSQSRAQETHITKDSSEHAEWWKSFDDPVLDSLIAEAYRQNYNLKIAGLWVLDARAALGIAIGSSERGHTSERQAN